jgi:hypothetical protein
VLQTEAFEAQGVQMVPFHSWPGGQQRPAVQVPAGQ